MANKFDSTKTKNLNATARVPKSIARSSGENNNPPDNRLKPQADSDLPKSLLEKLERASNSLGEVFKLGV